MALLRLGAVERVHLHFGLQTLAEGLGAVFVMAFLLRAGLSTPAVLLTFTGLLAGRFVLRPLVLIFAVRRGLKATLVLGTLITAASYPMLAAVKGLGAPLVAYCFVSSLGGVFYWTCYHAYFAAVGEAGDRGRQVAVREAIATVLNIAGPALGGWALTGAGPGWTFAAAGVVQAAAALPLAGAPDLAVARHVPGAFRDALPGVALFAADGLFAVGNHYLWTVMLFVSLGESFAAFGGAVAMAAAVGAACAFLVGRHIDAGNGARAATLAYALAAVLIVARALWVHSPAAALAANAAVAFSNALLMPATMAAVYNLGKAAPCPLRFSIATEGAWDLSCGAAFVLAAGLVVAGAPIRAVLLIGLPGAVAAALLLRRSYRAAQR